MRINTEVIKKLKPCADGFENWLKHYADFDSDILDFLDLDKITHNDKLWVTLRLLPRFEVEVFAIECAFVAQDFALNYAAAADATTTAATYYAAAADATTTAATYYAANAATYYAAEAASADNERFRQIESLKYLIINKGNL